MNINEHQNETARYAIYPDCNTSNFREYYYLTGGIAEELGEVVSIINKSYRRGHTSLNDIELSRLRKEIGDVYWYLNRLCTALNFHCSDVLEDNAKKLADRAERKVIDGEGDSR